MKRTFLLLMMAVLALQAVAQQADTLRGRSERYYYPVWYDQCEYYDRPDPFVLGGDSILSFSIWNGSDINLNGDTTALRVEVPRCMLLAGVAAMVTDGVPMDYSSLSSSRAVEYVMVMDGDSLPGSVLRAARWDTASPVTMLLSQDRRRADAGGGYGDMKFKVYEAIFESPVLVDSVFFMAGTYNSNILVRDGYPFLFEAKPTFYGSVFNDYSGFCYRCIPEIRMYQNIEGDGTRWADRCPGCELCGPFIPIPAMVGLTVLSDSLPLGSVEGGGTFRSGDSTVIRAIAAGDCRFVCWDDGVTANPRAVYLCGDATYTAHFVNDSSHNVRVMSNNTAWGTATGGGVCHHGSDMEIGATPMAGYTFIGWADGDTGNPRTVHITSDTVFTALFEPIMLRTDIVQPLRFSVMPNPAHDMITVTTAVANSYLLKIYDGKGRIVVERRFEGDSTGIDIHALPSGMYLVTLQSAGSPAAKRLIKL